MRKTGLPSALIFLLAFLVVMPAVIPGNAESGSPLNPSHRVLLSASELDYPPFSEVRNDGSADGFSVELLKAVAGAVGFDVVFEVGPWNEIKRELIDGRIDVLPLVSYSKERDEVLDFTAPYLRMHGTIFVRKDEKSIHNEADLKNKEVLVMRGDTAHEYALEKKLTDKLILTDSFEQAMKELSAGKHDAVLVQRLVGFQLIKMLNISNVASVPSIRESNLKPVAEPLSGFEQKFCIAVKDGNKDLLARLNEGLAIVISNGVYDVLYDKWFGPILPKPSVSPAMLFKYLLFILLPLLGVIGIVGFWYLRREVDRKTKRLTEQIETRKAAEQALRESEARFRLALHNAPVSVAAQDRDLRYIWAYSQRTDRSGEIIGRFDDEIFTPEEAAYLTAVKRRVLEKNVEIREQMWFNRPSGRVFLDVFWEPIHDEAGVVTGVASATVDLTSIKLIEEALKASIEEKEVLLKEIHHRVKNNMQVISSLVALQADESKDAVIRNVLKDVTHRVRSMAMIHEKLYQSRDLARIDFAEYTQSLLNYIWRSYGSEASGVRLIQDLEPVSIPVNEAVPCGLILNELVGNALKHAFPDNAQGEVAVSLHNGEQGVVVLAVCDNGAGLPEGFDWKKSRSLGLRLVQMLAGQLHADVEVNGGAGTEFKIIFGRSNT